jgi:hypothetical protein
VVDGDVLSRNNTRLGGMRVTASLIDSFTLDRSGRPHAAPGSPYAAEGLGPFGSQFRPTNPDQLFVDNAHNGTDLGTVSAYNDLSDGTLAPIGASPFADFHTAPCWQVISPDGRYLYARHRFWVHLVVRYRGQRDTHPVEQPYSYRSSCYGNEFTAGSVTPLGGRDPATRAARAPLVGRRPAGRRLSGDSTQA